MKAFLINLDHRTDRLAEAAATLKKLNIPFERVSAIDARTVNISKLIDWKKAFIFDYCRAPYLGQIGVYESHRKIWQKILDENLDQALVFEDDVIPLDFDERFLNISLKEYGLDQLRLEELANPVLHPLPTNDMRKNIFNRMASSVPTYGSAAYIMTNEGARKFLSAGIFWFNIDHFDLWEHVVNAKTAVLRPNLFVQSDSRSDINVSKKDILNRVQINFFAKSSNLQMSFADRLKITLLKISVLLLPWSFRTALRKKLIDSKI